MAEIKNLYETIGDRAYRLRLPYPEIPSYILQNLKYEFFDWQKEAFENLLTFHALKERENIHGSTHLMFNMATGTGKTLLMAASMLYYYQQGYRQFIFFVNQNNIVDKTENNFIDDAHTKYLFKEKIVIDDKTVEIKKVESFSDYPNGIEIKFTTIQKLYNDIHIERENQTTLNDLHNKNIVMLADEAHHLNADTKSRNGVQQEIIPVELTGKTSETEIERKGWEHTVIELILNKNGKQRENKNVLLEFTATIPANEQVAKKYSDKILYKFGLKEFLSAGYTKEINLISSTLDKKERVLQALLFHWYRHKIALRNGIANFKPVILFRSKTIEESKADYEEFLSWTDSITGSDFDFLKDIAKKIYESDVPRLFEMGKSRTGQVLDFIKTENIGYGELAEFIRNNFKEKNIVITNSKTNKTKKENTDVEQEKLLNSLEDRNNHIRAIFTVQRLTEGWDVLNLFDIVRLYEGRDEGTDTVGNRKAGSATIAEKQLIGRGVRYFPFEYKDKIKNKRKFDEYLDSELRILEELYFYSTSESRYIDELKRELRMDGYIRDDKIIKTFTLKKEFQESDFYQNTKIWYNEQIDNPNRKQKSLSDLKNVFFGPYKIKNLEMTEQEMAFEKQEDLQRLNIQEKGLHTLSLKFKDIEKHIFRKAINVKSKQENSIFQFERLREELEISSIEDLQEKEFLGDFDIKIVVEKNILYEDILGEDKLNIVLKFVDNVFTEIKGMMSPKIGSEFINIEFKKIFSEPKTKIVQEDQDSDRIAQELEFEKWYVLDSFNGTSEEKELIGFIQETIGNLESKYSEVYLLRNEEVYKIYDFEQGRGFQPDFILFLKGKDKQNVHYQIFIEPKGNEYIGDDGTFRSGKEGWKEIFLEQISQKYGIENVIKEENVHYKLVGLPFFNHDHNGNFLDNYSNLYEKSNNPS